MTEIKKGRKAQSVGFSSNNNPARTAVGGDDHTKETVGSTGRVPTMNVSPTISRGEMNTRLPQRAGMKDPDLGPGNVSRDYQDYGIEDIQTAVDRKGSPVFYIKEFENPYQSWSSSTALKLMEKLLKIPKDLVEEFLANAMRARLDYAGHIAGKMEGVYHLNGQKILALGNCLVPEDAEQSWDTLEAVLKASFPDEDSRMRFQCWLYHAWKSLDQRKWTPLPALVLIGEKGTCKSLLLEIVRYTLGNQMLGHALKYLTGRTRFNSDLVGSAVLAIDDEIANPNKARRVGLGQSIKKIAVTNSHRVEQKGVDPVTLDPHWRVVICANDEMDDLMLLPELNDSLRDKLLMLHCRKGGLPMPAKTMEEKEVFWAALTRDIPGFLHHMKDHPKRDDYGDGRMMVSGWQDTYIETALLTIPAEERLLELIDALPWWADKQDRTVSANELQSMLTGKDSPVRHQARQLLNWDNATGTLLGRIAKSNPDRVARAKPLRDRKWVITSPFDTNETTDGALT